jgi:hypothetical protein
MISKRDAEREVKQVGIDLVIIIVIIVFILGFAADVISN